MDSQPSKRQLGGMTTVLSQPALPRSTANGAWQQFCRKLDRYTGRCGELWEAAQPATLQLGPVIPLDQKLEREAQMNLQLEQIKARVRRFPRSSELREAWRSDLVRITRELAGGTLGLPEHGLSLFFTSEGVESTQEFVRNARAFDSSITDEALFQALRNLWVIQSIQLLLKKPVDLSAPTFAYSMLYPWTDNYLDDAQVGSEQKFQFNDWLDQRLCSPGVIAPDRHTEQVDHLIGLIEKSYPRDEFEEVYLCLRAIHHAQISSLAQQGPDCLNGHELLQISIRKGGTSVLADAFMAAGHLNDREAEFMFMYGVLLQFMDDLQDLPRDLANSHATIFTSRTERGDLDNLTAKFWSFAQAILSAPFGFDWPDARAIRTLILENCKRLLLQATARNYTYYTPGFVAELEAFSPCRFTHMRNRGATVEDEFRDILSVMRRQRQIDSVFDLLG